MGRRGSAVDAVDERTSGEMVIATHDETFTSSASQLSEPVAHLDRIFSESTQSAIETTTFGVAAYHVDLFVVRCGVAGVRHAVAHGSAAWGGRGGRAGGSG